MRIEIKMGTSEESRIRCSGFPINRYDAEHLLSFINTFDKNHHAIEPDIVVKLELLCGKWHLQEHV